MTEQRIPKVTAKRLPLYFRHLEKLYANGKKRVSSTELSVALQIDSATIRRDFSHLGELGRRGYGYDVHDLLQFLRQFLKQHEVTNVILVGVGNLGTALMRYNFYRSHNTKLVAGFDQDQNKIGSDVDGIPIYDLNRLSDVIRLHHVQVAILTVPVQAAQSTADQLIDAGIKGILNFTPARINTPLTVRVHHIDLTVELQSLIYFLQHFPLDEKEDENHGKS